MICFNQMVILSLILKRARIKALVKDKRAAIDAFGTYVEVSTCMLMVAFFPSEVMY